MVRLVCASLLVPLLTSVAAQDSSRCEVNILATYCGDVPKSEYYQCQEPGTINIVNETIESFRFTSNSSELVSTFQLSRSLLMEIPVAPKINHLLELVLSQNNISEIANLSTYVRLTKADLSHNQIETVPELELPNLTHLNLSHNRIVQISTDSFHTVKKLKYLDLYANRLTKIEMCTFKEVIYVNVSANPTLSPAKLLCKRCFFQTTSLSITGSPASSNCGMDEDSVITVTTRMGAEDDRNDERRLIVGVTVAAVAFLVAVIATAAYTYQKVLGRRQVGTYAPNAVKEPTEMTKLN